MVHMPWDQPEFRARRKKAKKKAKKKTTRKKVAKKATARKKAAKKKTTRKKAPARRGQARAHAYVVPRSKLVSIRKSVTTSSWSNQKPESKRSLFKFEGKTYWPLYGLQYVVDAVEVVPRSSWKGKTHEEPRGALTRPGFLKKIKGKTYVYVQRTQFIEEGSPLDR